MPFVALTDLIFDLNGSAWMCASSFRRGWWKPWNWSTKAWILVILAVFLMSPFVTRWICLWQVPDVVLPFDVDGVIPDEIPADQDAMVRYTAALLLFNQYSPEYTSRENSFKNIQDWYTAEDEAVSKPERKWDVRLDPWLLSRRNALDEYRLASEMERSGGPSLKTADFNTLVTVHQEMRNLARLAELEAVRCARSGELDAAWICHLTNLRCARHYQMPRFNICHLIGVAVRYYAYRGIARWAEHASLTTEQLQTARRELRTDSDVKVPSSELIKANYCLLRNWMLQPEAPNHLLPSWILAKPESSAVLFGKKIAISSIGQPDVLMRLARQVLVNNVEQIDLPLHRRRQVQEVNAELVFAVDPSSPRLSGQLDSARLSTSVELHFTRMAGLAGFLVGGQVMDQVNRRDESRRRTLDVALAAHQYQRRHGDFPALVEQLVPEFLESLPLDPMDAAGGPLRYRREENGEAIVWSIGQNAIDDGGDLSIRDPKDFGYRIRLSPEKPEPTSSSE